MLLLFMENITKYILLDILQFTIMMYYIKDMHYWFGSSKEQWHYK